MDKNILNKNEIKEIIENIRDDKLYFVNKKITLNITKSINELFPILNQNDIKNIEIFIVRLIDIISLKLGLNNIDNGREQWLINDNMDIKSLILIFLPFLDNIKDDGNVFKSLTSLKQILINNDGNKLNREILDKPRTEVMKKEFYYSNFSINLAALNNRYYNYDDKIFNGNADIIMTLMIHKFHTMVESIKLMANKLYVNWINVVPVSKENYTNEKMYQDTLKNFKDVKTAFDNGTETRSVNILNKWLININFILLKSINFDYDSSISLYNYPGVLSQLIYEDIKKIKWMIYCRNKNSSSGYYYIQVVSEMFNLTNMIKYKYHDLPSYEMKKFNKNYDKMLNSFLNNTSIIDNYSKIEQYDVMKNLMVFLVSSNSNIIKLEKNDVFAKFRINNNIEEEIDDDINNLNLRNLNSRYYYDAFNNVNRNLFWDYLRNSLLKLRYNYLGSFLFNGDSINKSFYYYPDSKLTLKNIYNYGKILTFEDFKEGKKYNYDKFMGNKQRKIFNILFNFKGNVNFIKRNLRLQLGKRNTDTWFTEVKKDLSTNIHKIVWGTLIHNGLLSKFTVNHDINDKKNLTNNDKMNKKIIANKLESIIPKYKNCNYFFTNDSYNNLPKIMDNNKETTYIKQLYGSKFDFYLAYSFNWIFQINFFNHFCYNNINYITGSTGQGKSTQVPKLYTYAFKALHFIANPKVVCTQPRLDPTENIAWVAQEAGLPIRYIMNDRPIYTDNYYMQFKHSQNNHMKEECYHPVIRFVTDGTIYNDIKRNIFLTKTYYDITKKKWVSVKDSTQYNAVLIDEAHEHNMNMDLILSDLRITCMRNSKVKLGIISATMDDDEPVYRAFYLDVPLPDSNSIWIDPRLHISPPGTTTKHKIVEHYSIDENPKENIIRTIRKVKEILKNYPVGQILVFSTGQGDILKLVEKINKETSSDVITLPYFSAMNTIYKRLVRNITDELPKLKNKKHRVHLEWGEKFISDKSVPNNIYKRAVIIATNVAEASITIPGLKFVVDNGYQKVSKYDMLKKTKSLIVEEISEASRLQRKGRVGRKEAGDVFYLYREGARAENPPKFKITQENISDILFSILSNQENLNEAIKLLDDVNKKEIFKEFIEHKIKDNLGKYYIVNPFEDKIKRNIIHEIISFNDKEQNRIDKEYFEGFFNNLSKNLMIMFVKENDRKEILDVSLQYNEKYKIKTTDFFKAVDSMSSKLMLERKYIITILMSKLANVFDEVFIMIPMIILLGNGLSSLATNRGKDFKYLLGKFGNHSSDIYSIYMIVSSFKNYFKDLTLFSMIDNKKKIIEENKNIYQTQQKLYNKYISINQGHYKSNNIIDEDTFQIFNKLNSMKIYDDEMRFQEWFKINKPLDEIYLKEFKDNNDIHYWCSSNHIEYNFIFNYYKSLISLYKSMETLDTNIDVSKNEINYFKLYGKEEIQMQGKSKVSNLNLLEKLELVFIYGNIDNLYFREPETDRYISFYSDSNYGFINNYFGKNISFNQTPTEFICCINSIERNDISLLNIIINLKPEILGKYLGTHFNKNNFPNYTKKKYRDKDTDFEITRIYRESRNSLISFYQKIYNNTGIEYHLLYNKEIDEDKESKTDNVKLYDMMKNLKL